MKKQQISFIDLTAALILVSVTAAVLAPVYVKAEEDDQGAKQKMTVCVSNLKQIDLGILMYTQDYDEIYPSGADYKGHGTGWASQVSPYLKSTAVLQCPSDPNPSDVSSYGYNSNCVSTIGATPSPPKGMRLAAFGGPAQTVSLFEVVNNAGSGPGAYDITAHPGQKSADIHISSTVPHFWVGSSPAGRGTGWQGDLVGLGVPRLAYATGQLRNSVPNSPAYSQGGGRHTGFACYGFADGHIKALMANEVSAGYSNDQGMSCGTDTKAANTGCQDTDIQATFSVY